MRLQLGRQSVRQLGRQSGRQLGVPTDRRPSVPPHTRSCSKPPLASVPARTAAVWKARAGGGAPVTTGSSQPSGSGALASAPGPAAPILSSHASLSKPRAPEPPKRTKPLSTRFIECPQRGAGAGGASATSSGPLLTGAAPFAGALLPPLAAAAPPPPAASASVAAISAAVMIFGFVQRTHGTVASRVERSHFQLRIGKPTTRHWAAALAFLILSAFASASTESAPGAPLAPPFGGGAAFAALASLPEEGSNQRSSSLPEEGSNQRSSSLPGTSEAAKHDGLSAWRDSAFEPNDASPMKVPLTSTRPLPL